MIPPHPIVEGQELNSHDLTKFVETMRDYPLAGR
jgi:hypothetical protein